MKKLILVNIFILFALNLTISQVHNIIQKDSILIISKLKTSIERSLNETNDNISILQYLTSDKFPVTTFADIEELCKKKTVGTYVVSNTISFSKAITIPEGVYLQFNKGGSFDLMNYDLDLNGAFIVAGKYQIFYYSGNGIVSSGTSNDYMYPEWFGAVGDAKTECGKAIQNSIDIMTKTGGIILFDSKQYKISTQIINKQGVILKGTHNPENRDKSIGTRLDLYYGKAKDIGDSFNEYSNAAIILKKWSGIEGFLIYYPEQNDADQEKPLEYSWCITTNKNATKTKANTDGVIIRRLMLLNPYKGIDLTNSAQFTINEIFGQPLYEGLRMDIIKDVGTLTRIHFWPFYVRTSDTMYKWIHKNAIAFNFGQADAISLNDLFAFGYYKGFKFQNFDNGAFWGQMNGCLADQCYVGLEMCKINNLDIVNSTFITTNISCGIKVDGKISRSFSLSNVWCYGTAVANAMTITKNATGNINVSNCNFVGDNGTSEMPIGIIQDANSTATLKINNCGKFSDHYLSTNYTFDGIKCLEADKDNVLLGEDDNFAFANWTDGLPDGWRDAGANSDLISQIDNGAKLTPAYKADDVSTYIFNMGKSFSYRLQALCFEIECKNITYSQFSIYFDRDVGGYTQYVYKMSGFNMTEKTSFIIPFMRQNNTPYQWTMKIRNRMLADATDAPPEINITNLKIVQLDSYGDNSFIDLIKSDDEESLVNIARGNYFGTGTSAPTNGIWKVGDTFYNNTDLTPGKFEKYICTEAGSPGTWLGISPYKDRLFTSKTLNFNSIDAQSQSSYEVTLEGITASEYTLMVTPKSALNEGLTYNAYVSADNTVTIVMSNITDTRIDPSSVTFNILGICNTVN